MINQFIYTAVNPNQRAQRYAICSNNNRNQLTNRLTTLYNVQTSFEGNKGIECRLAYLRQAKRYNAVAIL